MLSNEQRTQIAPRLKTLLVIYLALGGGIMMFSATIAIVADWAKLTSEASMMALMGAITGLMTYGMSFIIPKLLRTSSEGTAAQLVKQNGSPEIADKAIIERIVTHYFTNRIIVGALLEGGIFMNLVVFFIEPNTVSIAVFGIGLLLFLFRIPFIGRQEAAVEAELADVKRELQLFR